MVDASGPCHHLFLWEPFAQPPATSHPAAPPFLDVAISPGMDLEPSWDDPILFSRYVALGLDTCQPESAFGCAVACGSGDFGVATSCPAWTDRQSQKAERRKKQSTEQSRLAKRRVLAIPSFSLKPAAF